MKLPNLILLFVLLPQWLPAQLWADAEGGAVATGYNDVRITGSGGTFFSFPVDLEDRTQLYYRLRAGYRIAPRHEVFILYAPLRLTYSGAFDRNINFKEVLFSRGTQVEGTYKFNSYRATYRYYVRSSDRLDIGLGITIKVRDALIALEGGGQRSERPDLGGVPLINFLLHWKPFDAVGLLIDGDALAGGGGRAADVMAALTFRPDSRLSFRAGYRILEGGADNSKVYTFALFHYGFLGMRFEMNH